MKKLAIASAVAALAISMSSVAFASVPTSDSAAVAALSCDPGHRNDGSVAITIDPGVLNSDGLVSMTIDPDALPSESLVAMTVEPIMLPSEGLVAMAIDPLALPGTGLGAVTAGEALFAGSPEAALT